MAAALSAKSCFAKLLKHALAHQEVCCALFLLVVVNIVETTCNRILYRNQIKFYLSLLIKSFISLVVIEGKVFISLFCGVMLEAALSAIHKINARASGDALSVRASFKHGTAADWRNACATLFSVTPLTAPAMLRPFSVRTWAVGPCLICQASVGGQILQRTLEHISVLNRFVVLTHYVDGHATGTTEGVPFGARPGSIVLRDFAHPFEALQYPSRIEIVIIPYRELGVRAGDIPALRVLPQSDEEAAPLRNALRQTLGYLSSPADAMSLGVLDQLLACTSAALTAPRHQYSARRSARAAQRVAIDGFIEERLACLNLSAETILPEFGVSRATLYRLFEEEGGVRKYIVDRRLFRALLEILEGGKRRGRIQQAAKRWGFSSAANFNRSVRHVFGGTPGSLFTDQVDAFTEQLDAGSDPSDLEQADWVSLHS